MSINSKTKAQVDTLLTDASTTETEFKTGLQDVTTELDTINGWGNHADAGYLTSVSVSDLTNGALQTSTELNNSISNFGDNDTSLLTAAAISDYITLRLPSDEPPSDTERAQWDSAYDAVKQGLEAVDINSGTIDGTAIGANNASTGNFTTLVADNLTVNGTTTTLDSTNTVIQDNLIELNSGLTTANTNDSGIIIERGDTNDNAIMLWDESADRFVFGTTTATASSTGDIAYSAADLYAGNLIGTTLGLSGNLGIQATFPVLEIIGTSDATIGPNIQLHHNSSSPADNDAIGNIYFYGENNVSNKVAYGLITALSEDVTQYSEDGVLQFKTYSGAAGLTTKLSIGGSNGVHVNGSSMTINSDTAPTLSLEGLYSSPSDGQTIGKLSFVGKNSAAQDTTYARINGISRDVTDGTENGELTFQIWEAGSGYDEVKIERDRCQINSKLYLDGGSTYVDSIKDEDTMSSNSATALATQQSIKAYVDGKSGVAPDSSITLLATMYYTMDSGETNKIVLPNSLRNYNSLMMTVETSLGVSNFGFRNYDYIASNHSTMDRTDFYVYSQGTTSNGEFDMNTGMTKTYQTGTGGLLSSFGSEWGVIYSDNVSSTGENSFTVRNERSSSVGFHLAIYGVKN